MFFFFLAHVHARKHVHICGSSSSLRTPPTSLTHFSHISQRVRDVEHVNYTRKLHSILEAESLEHVNYTQITQYLGG